MNATFQNPLSLVGRLLLAFMFLPAGLMKIGGFAGTVGYISSVGMPMPTVAAALAILIEIGGGLALLAGFGTRIAALALAVFTLVASVYFHARRICRPTVGSTNVRWLDATRALIGMTANNTMR